MDTPNRNFLNTVERPPTTKEAWLELIGAAHRESLYHHRMMTLAQHDARNAKKTLAELRRRYDAARERFRDSITDAVEFGLPGREIADYLKAYDAETERRREAE